MEYKYVVVGAGIVGLATAWKLSEQRPGGKILVLDKEADCAQHQTGRNSGVIHSGVYYKPNSMKAKNCLRGADLIYQFCQQEKIPYEQCGKIIMATESRELSALEKIFSNGQENGIKDLKLIGPSEIKELEPEARGIKAIHVPTAGVVSYKAICDVLVSKLLKAGNEIIYSTKVKHIQELGPHAVVITDQGTFRGEKVITCAGVYADEMAASNEPGLANELKMIPFRGEYYELSGDLGHKIKGLIYPVPDANFPFLGVHVHKTISGSVECGPNALLAFGKEGYSAFTPSLLQAHRYLTFPGFWKFAKKHYAVGFYEWRRSLSRAMFLKDLQRLVPGITDADLSAVKSKVGIRAQLMTNTGELADDFMIKSKGRITHVLNAPSPAATSCLAIAEGIIDQVGLS